MQVVEVMASSELGMREWKRKLRLLYWVLYGLYRDYGKDPFLHS